MSDKNLSTKIERLLKKIDNLEIILNRLECIKRRLYTKISLSSKTELILNRKR